MIEHGELRLGHIAERPWLILGASGFVGSALTKHLRDKGIPARSTPAPRLNADPMWDVSALVKAAANQKGRGALRDAMAGVDCVIIAAGAAKPDAGWSAELLGANGLLPVLAVLAAQDAGVRRVVHLSSAAVQGRTRVLTESREVNPFSPYSRSKAIGELALHALFNETGPEVVIVRATSVQGLGRPTTTNLRRFARSRLSSVAGAGSQPSAVSSIGALCEFITVVGQWPGVVPEIVLQPWEGLSVYDVLVAAGGRRPHRLPHGLCTAAVNLGHHISRGAGNRWAGPIRRVEAMWFGQQVRAAWAHEEGVIITPQVHRLLGVASD